MPLSYISPIEKKINKTHFNFNTQEEITEKRGAEEISPENGKLTDLKGGSTFFLLLPSFFYTKFRNRDRRSRSSFTVEI